MVERRHDREPMYGHNAFGTNTHGFAGGKVNSRNKDTERCGPRVYGALDSYTYHGAQVAFHRADVITNEAQVVLPILIAEMRFSVDPTG